MFLKKVIKKCVNKLMSNDECLMFNEFHSTLNTQHLTFKIPKGGKDYYILSIILFRVSLGLIAFAAFSSSGL